MNKFMVLATSLFVAALNSLCVQAETIDADQACQTATDFLSTINGQRRLNAQASELSLRHTCYSSIDHVTPTYYIFVNEPTGCWVIAAADDRVKPILGYGNGGDFDIDQLPCNMRSWLNSYSEQIEFVQSHPEIVSSTPNQRIATSLSSISPMLTTSWGSEFALQWPGPQGGLLPHLYRLCGHSYGSGDALPSLPRQ